ncbi:hypothetical protein NM208_g10873 [Fusarium decemcellulare]|uniref:Uncharacterized protein n=1 Tax=Fusarium decemcellulare TaxID=57161 RepID=A0ACC1RWC3_9HYPO|nr:hypothetical protein NM208_g10873 [Fusarium decemcellulare]
MMPLGSSDGNVNDKKKTPRGHRRDTTLSERPDRPVPATTIFHADLPRAPLSASQIIRIATGIAKSFRSPEQKYRNVLVHCNNDIVAATAEEDTSRFIATPSDEARLEHPQAAPSVQRAATAKAIATDLRQRRDAENSDGNDESDHEWFDRVQAWVTENARARLPKPRSGLGPEWPAKRVPLPPGTMSNIAS